MAKSVYDEVYARSMKDPEGFWARAAEAIHWEKRWDRVFDDSRKPFYRWFTGGVLNTCYNALDLHIDRGRGKQRALVYDSPVTNTVRVFTYAELRDAVARVAGALRRQGIKKGDRVIVYMPMVPEAVVAMLACARIGAIHSVVFGGRAQARALRDPPATSRNGAARPGARPGLGRFRGGRGARRLRAGRRDRPALHPLHVGHDGRAEGGRAGQRWPRGRPQVVHGGDLRRRRGRGVLGGVGYRLGRGPLVYRLRAAARGLHDDPL